MSLGHYSLAYNHTKGRATGQDAGLLESGKGLANGPTVIWKWYWLTGQATAPVHRTGHLPTEQTRALLSKILAYWIDYGHNHKTLDKILAR